MNGCWNLIAGVCFVLVCSHVSVEGQGYQDYNTPTEWGVTDFPDPYSLNKDQQRQCGRTERSSVCDPNAIITSYEADQVDAAIGEVYRNTTCMCFDCQQSGKGYIIRAALMPRMKRIYPDSGNSSYMRLRDTEMYSYILTTRWKMEGLCNESLLILYSQYDNILYTLTRQLTARYLSDDDIKRITLSVRSYFDAKETVAQGLIEMIRQYGQILSRVRPSQ